MFAASVSWLELRFISHPPAPASDETPVLEVCEEPGEGAVFLRAAFLHEKDHGADQDDGEYQDQTKDASNDNVYR